MNKDLMIAGNWKMFKTADESVAFLEELDRRLSEGVDLENKTIVVFPPFTSLTAVRGISSRVAVGAQNMAAEDEGAYTGEISPVMLKGLVDYVLLGHSERRQLFGETDETINRKVRLALTHGFIPVLCVGETLDEREQGLTLERISCQLEAGLAGFSANEVQRIVIAYEPVWAIGTGKTATPGEAQEVHAAIRELLKKKSNDANKIFILYGGSVKPDNSGFLMNQPDIDGALIGGASLKVDSFFDIILNSSNPIHQ